MKEVQDFKNLTMLTDTPLESDTLGGNYNIAEGDNSIEKKNIEKGKHYRKRHHPRKREATTLDRS